MELITRENLKNLCATILSYEENDVATNTLGVIFAQECEENGTEFNEETFGDFVVKEIQSVITAKLHKMGLIEVAFDEDGREVIDDSKLREIEEVVGLTQKVLDEELRKL